MSVTTETSIWDDFGVNSAVITPDADAYDKHEQEMLALNVGARSGDDSYETIGDVTDSEGLSDALEGNDQTDILGEQDEDSIRVNTETGETEGTESEVDPADVEDVQIEESEPELAASITALQEHTSGFSAMVEKAMSDGDISQEEFSRINDEYLSDDGLSETTYKALESKGYTRAFVNAFIQGQDSLTDAYANKLVSWCGGGANFQATCDWLDANNPAMRDMLDTSIENMQTANVKAIFDSVKQMRTTRYGQAPQRNLASRSQPQRPQAKPAVSEGYSSISEMTKAMSDKRYANDATYRAEVERRVTLM